MTLPPERIGDKGQRYEVRATGYPKPRKSVIGWFDDLGRARRMAAAIAKAPVCTGTEIFDRTEGLIVA